MSSPAAKLGLAPSSLDLASCLLELEQIKLAVAFMAQLNLKPAFGGVVVLPDSAVRQAKAPWSLTKLKS